MKEYILFDLDGTLTDPGEGITKSVEYALNKYDIEVKNRTELYTFIGPPLIDSFMKYYDMSFIEAQQAVEYYREYFKVKGLYENEVYEGIIELLELLKKMGKKIILATSKPEVYAIEILKHFDLFEYFDFVGGATMDTTRSKKADVIRYVLESCDIQDLNQAIMIGDRKHDIIGANENGLESIGVLYGYGDLEELQKANATYIAKNVEDILKYI